MKVSGIECLKCHDKIWSRYTHDFRYCKCETVAVDGGRQYLRIIGDARDYKMIEIEVGEEK